MTNKVKKILCAVAVFALALAMSAMPVLASGDATSAPNIADALVDVTEEVTSQTKTIYNKAIVPIMCTVLAIVFVVMIVKQGIRHRQGETVDWPPIVIAGVCLIVAAISPTFVPALAGWT